MNIDTKICKTCNVEKMMHEFSKNKATKDGMRASCKTCSYIAISAWVKNNNKKVREKSLKYDRKNKDKKNTASLAWKKENKNACCIHAHNYRSRKRLSGGRLSNGLSEKLYII